MAEPRKITCCICSRRRDVKHMNGARCTNREVCLRVAANMLAEGTPAQAAAKKLSAGRG